MEDTMDLADYHLTDLRRLAKDIGVKSPTSLTKEKLIEEIKNIKNGISKPCFSNRGRPSKQKSVNETKIPEEFIKLINEIQKEKELLEKDKKTRIDFSEKKIEEIKKLTQLYTDAIISVILK